MSEKSHPGKKVKSTKVQAPIERGSPQPLFRGQPQSIVRGQPRASPRQWKEGLIRTGDLDQFSELFSEMAQSLEPGSLLLFRGEVGVGKTQAIRTLVEALGGRWVSSPSFAIHQRYAVRIGFVDHVDLYRVVSDEDLESTGFWDLLASPQVTMMVEWPERVPQNQWPLGRLAWQIEITRPKSEKPGPLNSLRTIEFRRISLEL